MRILKFFFTTLLQLMIVSSIVFVAGREILLAMAASAIKTDYSLLLAEKYGQICLQQFGYAQEYWTQLRFVSTKDYQLELVCADFVAQPVILESKRLPALVNKTNASSGFVVDERKQPYMVKLSVLGRSIYLFSEEHEIYSQYLFARDLDYALGPVTSCQAYGYQCCVLDLQSGQGEQVSGVADCPKSCFESCSLRPVVLSFNSRPVADFESRLAQLNADQSATFSYVIGNGKEDVFAQQLSKVQTKNLWDRAQVLVNQSQVSAGLALPIKVVVDFGDGQRAESQSLQDTFEHVYTCSSRICFFNAILTATDAAGNMNSPSELSKIIIKVSK